MTGLITKLLDQPIWVIALILGAGLVAFPCVTVDKSFYWSPHPPVTFVPVVIGIILVLLSIVASGFMIFQDGATNAATGIDLKHVKEDHEALWTTIGDCEVRVIDGRIEDQPRAAGSAVALPCNEYFDDECAYDRRSALGAYVNCTFEGQVDAFISLTKEECRKKLGSGVNQQKTDEVLCESFGAGRCVLLFNPLGRPVPIALVSTTTQRAGEGLASRISYLFDGMRELFTRLADARLNEVVMPVLGAGHGGIYPPLAFVCLVLAVAEAARYGQGGQRPRKVTIVVFRRDANARPQVDRVVVHRALALIGS